MRVLELMLAISAVIPLKQENRRHRKVHEERLNEERSFLRVPHQTPLVLWMKIQPFPGLNEVKHLREQEIVALLC